MLDVDGVGYRLPRGITERMIVEPRRPVVWISQNNPASSTANLLAIDFTTGEELHTLVPTRPHVSAPPPAFFDVDDDGDLDIVADGLVVDVTSGAVLAPGVYGDIDDDGFVEDVAGECAGDLIAAVDVDGDGIDDVVARDRICFGS